MKASESASDLRRILWKRTVNLEDSHLVARRVARGDYVLLGVFRIRRRRREFERLRLLRQCARCGAQRKRGEVG